MAEKEKDLGGRPKSLDKVDFKQVKLLGRFRATHETMAEHFDVCVRTIERYMKDEESKFCRVYKKAFADCKMSLAEAQINSALEGNPTLLIWLGKQHLNQVDKQEIKQDLTVTGAPTISFDNTTHKDND